MRMNKHNFHAVKLERLAANARAYASGSAIVEPLDDRDSQAIAEDYLTAHGLSPSHWKLA